MTRKLNIKLLLGLLGGFAIVGIAVHFLHAYQLEKNAYRLLERADTAAKAKDYDKSEWYYEQYRSFVPDDVDTVQKLAQLLDARGDEVGQVRVVLLMEQVLRLKPGEHALRVRLVHHLIALDRIPEAIDNLRKLDKAGHDRAEVLHMLGWCLEAKKEYTQAVKALEEAIKINPKQLKTHAILVEVLHDRLSQPEDARKVLDDMIAANAQSHQAYLTRARYLQRRGDEKGAQADLDAALKLAPDHVEVIFAVADAARARGDLAQATRLLEDAIQRFPKQGEIYRLMAAVQFQAKNDAAALQVLQAGVKHAPRSSALAALLIDVMIDKGQLKEAQAKLDELRASSISAPVASYLTARLHVAEVRWTDALPLLEAARKELGPGSEWSSRVNVLLGLCYRNLGDHEQELQAFQQAVIEDPTWIIVSLGLGEACLNNDRVDEASQALEPLQNADVPPSYWLLLGRVRLRLQMALPTTDRDWSGVEAALDTAQSKKASSPLLAILRAELLIARRDFAAAEAILTKAQAEHADDLGLWCARVDLAVLRGRIDEADQMLRDAATRFHDPLPIRLAQIRLWGLRGNADDLAQLALITKTSFRRQDQTRILRELGDTWHRLGRLDRAESVWRELAHRLPKDLRSRFALFELALQMNQPALAREWIGELKKIEGDKGWLWRFGDAALLVHTASSQRGQLDEARKKLEDLERTHKKWSRIPLLKGAIAEREGKIHQAIHEYTRAIDLGAQRPAVVVHLVELLVERREFGKAELELARFEQRAPLTRDLARLGAEVSLGLRDPERWKQAVQRAEQAVTLPTRDYRDALWLANVYQATDQSARAETLLQTTLEQARHVPDVWIAWLDHLAREGRRDLGLKELERMKKTLTGPRLMWALPRGFEALRMVAEADAAYQKVLRDATNDVGLLAQGADFYRRAGRDAEAQTYYERLLDPALAAPPDIVVQARRHLAVLLATSSKGRALELLDANKKTRGDTVADLRILLFIESLTPASRETALAKFQDSLRLQPPTPEERVLLARMLEAAGYRGQARTQLAEAVAESPRSAEFLVPYVRLLIQAEDWDEARRLTTRLEQLEPGTERVKTLRKAIPTS
mgnify:CR=1 FL=1